MLNISRRATIVSQCRLYAMRFSFKPQTRQKGSHSITLITLKRKLTTAPKEASRTVRGRLPSGPLSLRLREGRPLVMSGGALAMLSTLMTADLSMMIPNGEQYFGGESERESLNLREDEAHRGALEEDCFDEEGDEAEPTARVVAEWQGSWVLVRDSKLLAVMEQARMGLASVGNRAARAMAHVRRVIDDEMDRLRSLRLSRADVDAKRRSLHFLNPARETTLEVAARLVRWLRREAEALASGFSDGDTDASSQTDELSDGEQEMEERRSRGSRRIRRREDEGMSARRHWTFSLTSLPESTYGAVHEDSSPPIKARRLPSYYARTEWGESADETFGFVRRCGSSDALVSALARRALSETPARVLQRVYIHVGNVVDLGRASIVCRSWRERTRRDTSGRLVWKWTCRFGYLPPTGSMCCAGLWLSLADNVRAARYKLSAPLDDFGEVLTVRSVSWPGRDDSVSRWRAQIAVDVARAPLARLWRGLRVPGEYVTFDQAQADTIKPYRDLVARVCAHVAVAHPRLGYCQGVDYVVAYALRATCLNAVAAAKLVSTLFDDLDLAGLFEPGLPGLKKRCLELGLLLDARCPNFARHLKEHGVQMELFAAAWVQTLFVYVDALPLRCLDRVRVSVLLLWLLYHASSGCLFL